MESYAMPTTAITVKNHWFAKKVSLFPLLLIRLTPLATVSPLMLRELKRIIIDSEILKEDDKEWPRKNVVGRQELEIRLGNEHISFETAKLGALADVQDSRDPEGLRVFYYLVQDLKCLVFSLISLHFKIKPI